MRQWPAGVLLDDAYVAEDDEKAPVFAEGSSGLFWTSQEGLRTRLAMAWPLRVINGLRICVGAKQVLHHDLAVVLGTTAEKWRKMAEWNKL